MGQSASFGEGSIGADELKVTGDGSSGQVLASDGDGTFTWTTDTENYLPLAGGALTGAVTTNSTFDGVDIAVRDAILSSTTTTAGAALPKAGGTMSGNIAMGGGDISGGGTITGTFVGGITGNVTGNTSGTALTVTQAAQTAITSVGALTSLTVDDITINGSTISDSGDLTIDTEADLTLTALSDIIHQSTSTNSTAGHHIFKSYNTEIMRIDGANNRVGIGTSAPARQLEVKDSSDTVNIRLQGSVGYCDISGNGGDGSDFVVKPEGTEKFRVKENGNVLVVNQVGIGTTSLGSKLAIQGGASDLTSSNIGDNNLRFTHDASSDYIGIHFQGTAVTDMFFGREPSGDDLIISTANTGSPATLVTFQQNGNVGIGVTAPYSPASGRKILTLEGTSNVSIELAVNGARKGYIYHNATDITIENETSGGDITLTPHSTGDVNIGAGSLVIGTAGEGISFSATNTPAQSAGTGSSNTLDDYEEGTWSPTFYGAGGGTTTFTNEGKYTKIGNMVYCSFDKANFGFNSGYSGALYISGLPFSGGVTSSHLSCSTDPYYYPASVWQSTGECGILWLKNSNTSTTGCRIREVAGDSDTPFPSDRLSSATGTYFGCTFTYRT